MWHELTEHEAGVAVRIAIKVQRFHSGLLTRHPQLDDWIDCVIPEDREAVGEVWQHLCHDGTPPKLVMVCLPVICVRSQRAELDYRSSLSHPVDVFKRRYVTEKIP